jgi:hypothetical protein
MAARNPVIYCTVVLAVLAIGPRASDAQRSADSVARKNAFALLQSRDFARAVQAYDSFVRIDSMDAVSWQRLGLALYGNADNARAAAAFERAAVLQPTVPSLLYRAAKSYARLGDAARALDALNRAIAGGFANESAYVNDADLAPLRARPDFAELPARLRAVAHPCASVAEYRQLDFWIGTWDQTGKDGGPSLGTTTVAPIADGCALYETTVNPPLYWANALHFFDPRARTWRQEYVDSRARPTVWEGTITAGGIQYREIVPPGTNQLHRNTMTVVAPSRIHWLFEQSDDGGRTWRTTFDGYYVKRG